LPRPDSAAQSPDTAVGNGTLVRAKPEVRVAAVALTDGRFGVRIIIEPKSARLQVAANAGRPVDTLTKPTILQRRGRRQARHAQWPALAHDLNVPPTSNQAERDLRPAKIQQNVSGRLTSEQRTKDRYRICGYLSTAAKHGHNMIDALRDALTACPSTPRPN
jgi:transposase